MSASDFRFLPLPRLALFSLFTFVSGVATYTHTFTATTDT